MAVIEGVGDEVLYFFVAVVVLVLSALAWVSTNTADRPLLRTVLIVERHQPRAITSQPSNSANSTESAPPEEKPPETTQTTQSASSVDVVPAIAANAEEERLQRLMDLDTGVRTDHPRTNRDPAGEGILSGETKSQNASQSKERGTEESVEENVENAENAENAAPSIRINLKYLNDDLKRVEGRLEEQVGDFKKRHFSLELSTRNIVRLVFNGKLLGQDSQTLGNYGLHDNCVVHCLVHEQRSAPTPDVSVSSRTASPEPRGISHWALSNVLLVVLSCLLGVAWYGRYQFAQLYTATTTVALVGLTGIFTVFIIGIYIPDTTGQV